MSSQASNRNAEVGCSGLLLTGISAPTNIVLHASTNLIFWSSIVTNLAGAGTIQMVDPYASDFARRFYRCEQR